jgi:hypothetical protein
MQMDWIKKRFEQQDDLRKRREKISSGADPVWGSLGQAIKDALAEYQKEDQYGRFESDGRNHHVYWVRYLVDTPNRNTEKKKTTVTLDMEEATVTAVYVGVPFEPRILKLDLNNAELVCLKSSEKEFDGGSAAQHLLDPFLFPDLASSPLPEPSIYSKRGIRTL